MGGEKKSLVLTVADAQERQKMQYDARHQQGSYKEGESVLVKNMKKVSKKGDKMEQRSLKFYSIYKF